MNPAAAAYAQRILLTVFLASFGVYLLIATVTYTPFDPGWTHVSSDTLQVTNASGIAGAWIADLLYGFVGRAALLLPVFIITEAIQLWWPHSFLSRPFRFAAEFFLLLIVATLFSLHLLEPADTMTNASGGIVGYEIGRRILGLVGMIPSTLFLVTLFLFMITFVFGIRWHKTMDAIGQIPMLLQELFYRNVPEHAAAPDRTMSQPMAPSKPAQSTPAPTSAEPAPVMVVDEAASATPATFVTQESIAQPASVAAPSIIQSGQRWTAHSVVGEALQRNPDDILANIDQVLAREESDVSPPVAETAQASHVRIEPTFGWQDQSLFDELLDVVPGQTPSVSAESAAATSAVSAAQAEALGSIAETQPAELSAQVSEVAVPTNHVDPLPPHAAMDTAYAYENHADIDVLDRVPSTPVPAQSDTTFDVLDEPEWFAEERIVEPYQPATAPMPVVATPSQQHTAAAVHDDFDAPLTDAMGRPMSRAMQVVAKRADLPTLPGLDLLELPDPNRKVSYTAEQLERLSKLLEIKLQEFNVKAQVVEAQPGPVVTRFELELAPGVKASKVTNISRDLARSMSMASVRVVEVIPGKPYIGIEVPNSTREMVRLIELLETPTYRDPAGLLTMAMGKDIAGRPVLTDLAKAPHMLVAGTTGSGKSVAVNAMLLSMLLKYTPQQLRLILIDPKQLELANYGDIPHLLTPVVTDMKDAVNALNWSVNEMERRYKLMTFLKVRKIDEFNRKVNEAIERGEDLLDPLWKPNDSAIQDRAPRLQPLPLIVIVADEFADMIMQVGKKAEELITRLAQKSRAAGIHLMLATQRPSVDVITGLIKANIPTRVALRVNSKIDSRTILDGGGAEDLLGHGDMLFLAPGKIEPERVHGAFISDDEVNRICDAWRERGSPDYVDEILDAFDEEGGSSRGFESGGDGDAERDPMYDQAVQFVLETRKASASALQRKFSLGYNRAARLIDNMEEAGIISPMGPSGKRDILV